MAFVQLLGGGGAASLHMTSEPVRFPGPGVPVEVPDGYLSVLLDREMTRPLVVVQVFPEAPAPEAPPDEDDTPDPEPKPTAPKKGGRKPKEA